MLVGICPEVVDLLKDKSVNPDTFEVLRKMKPMRQIEAAELMNTAGNYTSSYAKALLAATRQADLVKSDQPKKIAGLTAEQMARMEREMETLQQDLKSVESRYGDDVLQLGDRVGLSVEAGRQCGNQALSWPAPSRDPLGVPCNHCRDLARSGQHGMSGIARHRVAGLPAVESPQIRRGSGRCSPDRVNATVGTRLAMGPRRRYKVPDAGQHLRGRSGVVQAASDVATRRPAASLHVWGAHF